MSDTMTVSSSNVAWSNMPVSKIDLTLTRFCYSPMGTFGEMVMPDGVKLYTVEKQWLGNAPSISCIPPGVYSCRPQKFFRGGYDAVDISVPGRSHILFHIANVATDVEGCIGVCSKLGALGQVWAGLGSKAAFEVFMGHYGGRQFSLKIQEFSAK